jgi:two-component system sensor histidine kinase YesM
LKFFISRLANKLILTFTVTISVFIMILIIVSYNRTNDILINDFINTNQSTLRLVNMNFQNYIDQIDELSITFRKDNQFMDILTGDTIDSAAEIYLENQIKILFYSRNDIEQLRFYIPSQRLLYTISRTRDKLTVEEDQDLTRETWYQKTIHGRFFRFIEPLIVTRESSPGRERAFLTFHRALVSIPGLRPLGIISLSFNQSLFGKMIRDTYNPQTEALCIYGPGGNLFYFSNSDFADISMAGNLMKNYGRKRSPGNFRIKVKQHDYLAVFQNASPAEWRIVKLIPLNLIRNKVRQTRNLSFLMGAIFIILFTLLIIIVSNTITSPLRKLARQMDAVGAGNFNAAAGVRGSYEIVRLSERFNSMVDQINQLIREKYLAEINEKTARLKALEAQINPHFLYNSLQAIATKAVMGGLKDISQMVEALAYILRYCIKGGDRVKISEEIEHVRKYLLLQTVRYEERLSVEIRLEQSLSDILIPKLSVQTLIENAVQHALEHMTRAITICINIYNDNEKNQVFIEVSDDGPGIDPGRLEQVLRDMNEEIWTDQPNASIGLKNLNSRLKLMYGEKARLKLESNLGQGTKASIILPGHSIPPIGIEA